MLDAVSNFYYNTTTQLLSWDPPLTLAGVDIYYYIVTIGDIQQLTSISNELSLHRINFTSCQQYTIKILGVNAVGNGTSSMLNYKHVGGNCKINAYM